MQSAAWAVRVQNSQNILVFGACPYALGLPICQRLGLGAGLYSFFQNYGQGCLTSENCQSQIFDIDSASTISVYSLSTVATTFQLSVNENGIINQNANVNGFASTVTSWTRS